MTTQLSGVTQSHLLLDQKMKDEQIQIQMLNNYDTNNNNIYLKEVYFRVQLNNSNKNHTHPNKTPIKLTFVKLEIQQTPNN